MQSDCHSNSHQLRLGLAEEPVHLVADPRADGDGELRIATGRKFRSKRNSRGPLKKNNNNNDDEYDDEPEVDVVKLILEEIWIKLRHLIKFVLVSIKNNDNDDDDDDNEPVVDVIKLILDRI